MVNYPAVNGHKVLERLPENFYIFLAKNAYGHELKIRRQSAAKSFVTKKLMWYDRHRSSRAFEFSLDAVKIYKLNPDDSGSWLLIYEDKSPMCQAFTQNQLTIREARDSIEW